MDKYKFAELQRDKDMEWYQAALKKRQDAVTEGVEGFSGAGTSRWAMTDEYQQHEMQDRAALKLSERRAKQNYNLARKWRPFWGVGLKG